MELKKSHPDLFNEALNAAFAKEEAKHKFEIELHKDELKKRNVAEKGYDIFADLVGTTKALTTGFDLSATMIQNVVYMFSHPVRGARAFGTSISHLTSERRFNNWLAGLHNSKAVWDLMQKSGLDITEPSNLLAKNKEEIFDRNLLNKDFVIKGKRFNIGKWTSAPFERAFTSMGNAIRAGEFVRVAEKFTKEGKTFENSEKLYKDLAALLNTQTGRGKLPQWMDANSKIITLGIWSPRLMASRLNLLGLGDIGNPIFAKKKGFYASLSPEIRKKALLEFGKFVSTVIGVYAIGSLMGGEADLEPESVTFGDFKVGSKSYNLFGGFSQYVKLAAIMAMGERKIEGKEEDISDAKGKSRGDIGAKFMRGKVTPMMGVMIDLLYGKDFNNKPITAKEELIKLTTPLSLRDISKNFERDGLTSTFANGLISTVGINVKDDRDYESPKPKWKDAIGEQHADLFKVFEDNKIDAPESNIKTVTYREEKNGVYVKKKVEEAEPKKIEQYEKVRKENIIEQLKEIKSTKVAYVNKYGDEFYATSSEDRDEIPFNKLTPEQLKKLMSNIKSEATKVAKQEVFDDE
jgi:hypothetical protein